MTERVIALIDMDCFYCQVEARLNPSLIGKPMAVVQYNTWKGGGIIAVNYEARDFGVTRHLRGNEAKEKCPEIVLVQVPELRGKADLTKYRDAGREVVNVLSQFSNCVERASVDEAYIDLTREVEERLEKMETLVTPEQLPNTFIVGFSEESNNDEERRSKGLHAWLSEQMRDSSHTKLAVAGVIVEEMREAVFKQTGFRCSAGIGHNKVLGKLVCGLHKPNRQTILPQAGVADLYRNMPVQKVRHLGGKLGESVIELLGCKVMADLMQFSEAELQAKFDLKNGTWLYNIARGYDHDPVTPRLLAKSIGCCKAFKGTQALTCRSAVEQWTHDLAKELAERMAKDQEENKRSAKLLTVSFILGDVSSSRSSQFNAYNAEKITADAIELIRRSNADQWSLPIKYLGLSASKFVDESLNQNTIQTFFKCIDKSSSEVMGENALSNSNVDPVKSKVSRKETEQNHSFFLKYFKSRGKDCILNTSGKNNDVASTSSETASSSKDHNNETNNRLLPKAEITQLEDLPTCSKSIFSRQSSISNDSVTFISLGEIFPDINEVDGNLASLLPSPMQRELDARRKSKHTLKDNNDLDITSNASTRVQLFRSQDADETKDSGENSRLSDFDPFHLDESTDVDDDLLPEEETKQVGPVSRTECSTKIKDSTKPSTSHCNEDSSSSLPEEVYVRGQLCGQCSKHIPLDEFTEHLDFHAAQELHKELNSAPIVRRVVPDDSVKSEKCVKVYSGKKRGRPRKNVVSATNGDKKLRSITAYFTTSK